MAIDKYSRLSQMSDDQLKRYSTFRELLWKAIDEKKEVSIKELDKLLRPYERR